MSACESDSASEPDAQLPAGTSSSHGQGGDDAAGRDNHRHNNAGQKHARQKAKGKPTGRLVCSKLVCCTICTHTLQSCAALCP